VPSAIPSFSYVLPLRMQRVEPSILELVDYIARLGQWCDDIIVVDGSPAPVFTAHHRALAHQARHVEVDPARRTLMGKVGGVLTGLDLARHERVVIADDDVRFDAGALERVVRLLSDHDLVRPQNYFCPRPWHALWDTARTLINRAVGGDFPGSLGVRRTVVLQHGGYDGDVLFENLELIRTVRARRGRVVSPLDLFVRRLPPSAAHFWGQRTRQAYDDFALPARMAVWLSIVPAAAVSAARRRVAPVIAGTATVMVIAEAGRRRGGGSTVFPAISSVLAPLWVAERGVCAWLALWQRLRFGGIRYGDSVIRTAAHSPRSLRRRWRSDRPEEPMRRSLASDPAARPMTPTRARLSDRLLGVDGHPRRAS
jgi:hypothetical protein